VPLGLLQLPTRRSHPNSCYHGRVATQHAKQPAKDAAAELAIRLTESLARERIIPRFVDSYVVENGRQALQVHAALYRDLLALLQREALLALAAYALQATAYEEKKNPGSKPHPKSKPELMAFRRKFLNALTRQENWTAGDALDFQSDLQMYEQVIVRSSTLPRVRKLHEAANHPFVDRCAFLLDSSFLEKARLAASRALADLEDLASQAVAASLQESKR